MRHLTAIIAALFLTACAGPRYQAAQSPAEGEYFIASSAVHAVHYDARYYGAFQTYGIYPWWEYGYYSPNFYPHYFAVWYPPRHYGFYGHYDRHDWYGPGFRPHRDQPHGISARHTNPPSQAPVEVAPVPTVRVPDRPIRRRGDQSIIDVTSDPGRQALRRRHWPTQPVPSAPAAPLVPATMKSMPIRSAEPFAGAGKSPSAAPARPAAQGVSPHTPSRASLVRERRIPRRDRSPLEP